MQHMFFHLRDGPEYIEDPEGHAFLHIDAARVEATESLREILADRLRTGTRTGGLQVEICDAGGHLLTVVPARSVLG